jgi:IstB-like ATP binding protein
MLRHPTLDQLQTRKLTGMVNALSEQMERPASSARSCAARRGLRVDREFTERADRRLTTRLRHATLRQAACGADRDDRHPRGLDTSLLTRLAACQWLREPRHVLSTGSTGVGKPQPRNYPCRSQRRTGTDHHCHRSSAPAVWPDPHAGRDDPPCDTRPVWCGVAAAPNRTTGACASHQPRI